MINIDPEYGSLEKVTVAELMVSTHVKFNFKSVQKEKNMFCM